MDRLLQHSWPGNVRELQNMVERAVIMTESGHAGAVLRARPARWSAPRRSVRPAGTSRGTRERLFGSASFSARSGRRLARARCDEVEKEHILRVLEAMNGNRTQAANVLQISIRTLRNKLNEYRIDTDGLEAAAPEEA